MSATITFDNGLNQNVSEPPKYHFRKDWNINDPKSIGQATDLINGRSKRFYQKNFATIFLACVASVIVFPLMPVVHAYFARKMNNMALDEFEQSLASAKTAALAQIKYDIQYHAKPKKVDDGLKDFQDRFILNAERGNFTIDVIRKGITSCAFSQSNTSLQNWNEFKRACIPGETVVDPKLTVN